MIFGSDGGKWYGDDYYAISYHIELNEKLPCVFELCIKKAERVVRLHNDHFADFLIKSKDCKTVCVIFYKRWITVRKVTAGLISTAAMNFSKCWRGVAGMSGWKGLAIQSFVSLIATVSIILLLSSF